MSNRWIAIGFFLAALGYGHAGVQNLPDVVYGWGYVVWGLGLLLAAVAMILSSPSTPLLLAGFALAFVSNAMIVVVQFGDFDGYFVVNLLATVGLGICSAAIAPGLGGGTRTRRWSLGLFVVAAASFLFAPVEILDETYRYLVDDVVAGIGLTLSGVLVRRS